MKYLLIAAMLVWGPTLLKAQGISPLSEADINKRDTYLKYDPKGLSEDYYLWSSLGLGISKGASFSTIISIAYQFEANVILFRASRSATDLDNYFSDVGLLYGLALNEPSFHTSIAIGLSRVVVRRQKGFFADPDEIPPTFGVPVQIEYNHKLSSYHGLGLALFANINKEESFIGLALLLHLGNLL